MLSFSDLMITCRRYLAQTALSLLMPWYCIGCRQPSDQPRDLCQRCQQSLPWRDPLYTCQCCAAKLSLETTFQRCAQCLLKPPQYDCTFALWNYKALMVTAIHQLKFYQALVWGRLLGEMMAEGLQHRAVPRPQVIIPVPLHRSRLRQRGFNQAVEIARPIAKGLSVPLDITSCYRVRSTRSQASLPIKKRLANVHHAFQAKGRLPAHIAIVDDVMTSGHTVNALSQVLRAHGARWIEVWCCARAGEH